MSIVAIPGKLKKPTMSVTVVCCAHLALVHGAKKGGPPRPDRFKLGHYPLAAPGARRGFLGPPDTPRGNGRS